MSPGKRVAALAASLFGLAALALSSARPAFAGELGRGTLHLEGAALSIAPESQTVPLQTPTIVTTHLTGVDATGSGLGADGLGELRVLGDFTGPGLVGVVVLEATPNEPFRIPALTLEGEYRLDNIRLQRGEELLSFAAPQSAIIRVTQVLVTRVTSRPLTLDEIRQYGIVVGGESFQAFQFTFGFGVLGDTVSYDVPVIWRPTGTLEIPEAAWFAGPPGSSGPGSGAARFSPPELKPFLLETEPLEDADEVRGGCPEQVGDCSQEDPAPPIPGVILFPAEVSRLNQFFSVLLMAQNGAPAGDPLTIRDLTGSLRLPAGLRAARTSPPTPLGAPVPIRVPGPDGKTGTADDITFLIAQATGQAEYLVEGIREGTHVVQFDLEGVLEGMPSGPRRISGTARGAVIVRDPQFGISISHPDVVRRDEEYTLRLAVTNHGTAPANLISVTLPPARLAGAELVDPLAARREIPTLLPGEGEIVEFRVRSLRTGRVVATSVRAPGSVTPSFELTSSVGDADVPLSPNEIVLPRATESLPTELVRHALGLVGLGFSASSAGADYIGPDFPLVSRRIVDSRVATLAAAGQAIALGDDPTLASHRLALEWLGASDGDTEWDLLRRRSRRGGQLGAEFARAFASDAAENGATAAWDRLLGSTVGSSASVRSSVALARGGAVQLELRSRTSGRGVAGGGLALDRLRELPFAEIWTFGDGPGGGGSNGGQLALVGVAEEGGYELRLRGEGSIELEILLPASGPDFSGVAQIARWGAVSLTAADNASVGFGRDSDTLRLLIDRGGDGSVDEDRAPFSLSAALLPAFEVVSAVQNAVVDPSGHVIDVLLSNDVPSDALATAIAARFEIPGYVSNGGALVNRSARGARLVRVVFDNPVSPLEPARLRVSGLRSVLGQDLSPQEVEIEMRVTTPGVAVEGVVVAPDGQPSAQAIVELFETDLDTFTSECVRHRTASVRADDSGRYRFGFVRQTECGDVFSLRAVAPATGHKGSATGRVRLIGQTTRLDIVMLGRGTVRGRIAYDDGSIPQKLSVVGVSPVFHDGRRARTDGAGNYDIGDLPVGTISLSAQDDQGNFVLATVEIPAAGAVVEKNLVLLRRPGQSRGELRGVATRGDDGLPVLGAWVALYTGGSLIGVRRSDESGKFDFGTVPAGLSELEAFDSETGRAAVKVLFDLRPDRINEVAIVLRDDRGTVEGRVYRQGFTGFSPVPNAVVYAIGTPFHTTTDATGFYRLENVFAGRRGIAASDPVSRRESRGEVTVGAGQTASFDLVLPDQSGGNLAGLVLGTAGQPVAGATVHLEADDQHWFREAFTDLEGRFVMSGLAPRSYTVHAFRGSAGAVASATIRFPGDTGVVTVRFKEGRIGGTVKARGEDGQLVGVRSLLRYRKSVVRLGLIGLELVAQEIETDANGRFEITGALAGPYQLTVFNSFHGQKSVTGEITQHGQTTDHQVVFERNGAIFGRVLKQDGVTPAAGARVALLHHPSLNYEVVTDVDGSFRFDLVPPGGTVALSVVHSDGVAERRAWAWAQFNRFGQQLEMELVLSAMGSVGGVVQDGDGNAVPAARVWLVRHGLPGQDLQQETGADGTFRFVNVFVGNVALRAQSAALGGLGGGVTATLETEGEHEDVVIRLQATGFVAGRVTSPLDGSPVANAEVNLHLNDYWFSDTTRTDVNGDFRFDLVRMGAYTVRAFDPRSGRRGKGPAVTLSTQGQTATSNVVLEARGEVWGHLFQPDASAPVLGATVSLRSSSLSPLTTYSTTDESGIFDFGGIPQGGFALHAREPQGRRVAGGSGEVRSEGERVQKDLYLERNGSVEGRVRVPAGHPGGADALFSPVNTLLYQDGLLVGATLDNPFRFDGIIAGRRFDLVANEPGGQRVARASGTIHTQGEVVDLDLRMSPVGQVVVQVQDGNGAPVAGTNVEVYVVTSTGGRQWLNGNTGDDAEVTFIGVDGGTVYATARSPLLQLGGSTSALLELDGATLSMVVRLESTGEVRGRVLRADGTTPAEATLAVLRASGRIFYALTDAAGNFVFRTVPVASFTLDFQEDQGLGQLARSGRIAAANEVVDLGTLVLDDADPFVVSIDPGPGSVGVSRTPQLRIHFSEPLARDGFPTFYVRVYPAATSSSPLHYTLAWEDGDRTAVLTPVPLGNYSAYTLDVPAGVRDLGGRYSRERVVSSFRTIDDQPPRLTASVPAHGATQVASDVQLRLTFDEPVDPLSLSGSSLRLVDTTAGVPLTTTFTVLSGEQQVLLTPVQVLASEHDHLLQVSGVRDRFGNVQASVQTVSFRTVDSSGPTIALSAPAGPYFDGGTYALSASGIASPDLAAVLFFSGPTLLSEDTQAPFTTSYRPSATDLAAGAVELAAIGRDLAGNLGARVFLSREIRADLPPTVTLAPTPSSAFFTDTVTFAGTIDDAGGLSDVRVTVSGTAEDTFVISAHGTTRQQFTRSYTMPAFPGNYTYYVRVSVRATDLLGKVTEAMHNVTLSRDETPPVISNLAPPDGSLWASDTPVTLSVDATDNSHVTDVLFTFAGKTFRDEAPPYQWTTRTPVVTATGPRPITARATDRFGNSSSATWNLIVTAPDLTIPVAKFVCPATGDGYVSGFVVPLSFQVSDDFEVVRYRILINGVLAVDQATTRVGGQPVKSLAVTWPWTPPAGATPGDSTTIRIEAVDVDGRVGTAEVTLVVPTGTVLSGTRNLDPLFAGQSIVLASGNYTAMAPLSFGDLSMLAGAIVKPRPGETLDVTGTARLRVGCGASLDASALGYAGGTAAHPAGFVPPGVAGSLTDAGGSHGGGGDGWDTFLQGKGGETYDSVVRPSLAGGGGSYDGVVGKRGGGVVRASSANLELEGTIAARGENAESFAAAGAGGSILVEALNLRGAGQLDASGGDVPRPHHNNSGTGIGGAGRIALHVGSLEGFDPRRQALARGGKFLVPFWEFGAAGTIYVRTSDSVAGDLIVDNRGARSAEASTQAAREASLATALPRLGSGAISAWSVDETTSSHAWVRCALPCRLDWLGAEMRLYGASGTDLGAYRVIGFDAVRGLQLSGAAGVVGATGYRGEYRFDTVEIRNDASLVTHDPLHSETLGFSGEAGISGPIEVETLTVPAGTSFGPAVGFDKVSLRVAGTLTVEEGGAIDVTARGFAGGVNDQSRGSAPPGVLGSPNALGGSHGGRGHSHHYNTVDPRNAGEVYGSIVAPFEAGGGGGGGGGHRGGGVLDLEAAEFVIDGAVRARGGLNNSFEDGGAGGSIWLRGGALRGSGLIDARGGDSESCGPASWQYGGAGGGGRISLHIDDVSSFGGSQQVRAWGGAGLCYDLPAGNAASAGTVFTRDAASTYGRLLIDGGVNSGGLDRAPLLETELPALGSGALSSTSPVNDDLWVERPAKFASAWLGAWMVLRDSAGSELGEFEVIALDAAGRARLAGAAAQAGSAVSHRGLYRFDSIDVLHGAGLSTRDTVRAEQVDIRGSSQLAGHVLVDDLVVRSGSLLRPVKGSSQLVLEASERLVLETGAIVDVSGLGYARGTSASPHGQAPPGVRGSEPDAGGSHGGPGEGSAVRGQGKGGDVYGSVVYPAHGGGGSSYNGGATFGGGVAVLRAPEVVLDGSVLARESHLTVFAAIPRGAGGSVRIEADVLRGTGRIDASGWSGGTAPWAQPGGGGRVALHVGELLGFNPDSQVTASGGWNTGVSAGTGTVFVREGEATYGRLILDGGQVGVPTAPILPTTLPPLGTGVVAAIGASTPSGADETTVERVGGAFSINWPGAWMVLQDANAAALGSFEVLRLDAQGRAVLRGVAPTSGVVSYRGEHRFARVDLRNGAGWKPSSEAKFATLAVSGTIQMEGRVEAGDLVLAPNASIGIAKLPNGKLEIVAQNLVVPAGAVIDVSGRGYPDHMAPDGVRAATPVAGGSHGGIGGQDGRNVDPWPGTPGEVFDSPLTASLAGGGAAGLTGLSYLGGGVLSIEAENLVLDGQLLSRSATLMAAGYFAGAGGSIRVRAESITGSGLIDASVVDNGPGGPGLGGGGRIVLESAFQGFDPLTQAIARGSCTGSKCAAPGTVYFRAPNATYGSLLVDQRAAQISLPAHVVVPNTTIPSVGTGTVGEVVIDPADPSDAWVVPFDPVQRFGHGVQGAFVRLPSADFRILAVSGDRRSVLLDGAASTVQVGQSFSGVWKFDSVYVRGRARLQFFNPLEAPLLLVEPGSQLLVP